MRSSVRSAFPNHCSRRSTKRACAACCCRARWTETNSRRGSTSTPLRRSSPSRWLRRLEHIRRQQRGLDRAVPPTGIGKHHLCRSASGDCLRPAERDRRRSQSPADIASPANGTSPPAAARPPGWVHTATSWNPTAPCASTPPASRRCGRYCFPSRRPDCWMARGDVIGMRGTMSGALSARRRVHPQGIQQHPRGGPDPPPRNRPTVRLSLCRAFMPSVSPASRWASHAPCSTHSRNWRPTKTPRNLGRLADNAVVESKRRAT